MSFEADRCRELFPLPCPDILLSSRRTCSRVVARRAHKKEALLSRARDAIQALNTLVSDTGLSGEAHPSVGSAEAAERVTDVCAEFSDDFVPDCTTQEAVDELVGSHLS